MRRELKLFKRVTSASVRAQAPPTLNLKPTPRQQSMNEPGHPQGSFDLALEALRGKFGIEFLKERERHLRLPRKDRPFPGKSSRPAVCCL